METGVPKQWFAAKKHFFVACACIAFGAFFLGRWSGLRHHEEKGNVIREGVPNYTYINPLLFCNISDNKEFDEFLPLKGTIQRFIDDRKALGGVADVSVYFRDMNPGNWFGINENKKYPPASLLKIPTMIAYFKQAEAQPKILEKEIKYDGQFDDTLRQHFKPSVPLEKGETYTVDELTRRMIVFSDNNAWQLLRLNIHPRSIAEVYTDLGLSLPASADEVELMSVKMYSYAFRVLYNASYLSREFSEKALEILNSTDFAQGIRAGVPSEIKVAHKFGEHAYIDPMTKQTQSVELHDCGIVYYEDHPYFLCIMTQGADYAYLTPIVQGISTLVYDHMAGAE